MPSSSKRRIIAAGTIGNVLEWYDFSIYGYFATAIGRTFFPNEEPVTQVLAAFGVFAAGYLMRPLGGIVVGHIGDKFGRPAALTFSIAAMALPTFLVGILPGYHTLGLAAPILLTLLRMLQGVSVGGAAARPLHSPLAETLRNHGGLLARLAGFAVFNAVGFYLVFLYVVSWLQYVDGIAPAHALGINTLAMVALLPVMLGAGWLSDRVGRKGPLLAALALCFVAAVPLFGLMHHDSLPLILAGQMGLVLLVGVPLGIQPAFMVEATPVAVRCTVVALGFNSTFGIVGGLTPLVATWLVHRTDDDISPAYMIMAAAVISFAAVLTFGKRRAELISAAPP